MNNASMELDFSLDFDRQPLESTMCDDEGIDIDYPVKENSTSFDSLEQTISDKLRTVSVLRKVHQPAGRLKLEYLSVAAEHGEDDTDELIERLASESMLFTGRCCGDAQSRLSTSLPCTASMPGKPQPEQSPCDVTDLGHPNVTQDSVSQSDVSGERGCARTLVSCEERLTPSTRLKTPRKVERPASVSSSNSRQGRRSRKRNSFRRQVKQVSRKLIIIGDVNVGKTRLVARYMGRYNDQQEAHTGYMPTIGVDFALKVIKWSDTLSIKLQLWDIAGQERFTSMTRVYYKDTHACIIMFDLTQRSTFLNAMKWKKDLDSKCALADGSPVPCMLLANKCDLPHREVEQAEIETFCKEQDFIGWTETSVKDGLMVEDAMKFLLEDMLKRYADQEGQGSSSSTGSTTGQNIQLRPKENASSSGRCSC